MTGILLVGASLSNLLEIAEWTKASVLIDGQEIDVSSINSQTFNEFLQGRLNWKINIDANWYPGSTLGQHALISAAISRTVYYFMIRHGSSGPNLSGAGYVRVPSFDVSAGASVDAQKIRFEIRGSGTMALCYH